MSWEVFLAGAAALPVFLICAVAIIYCGALVQTMLDWIRAAWGPSVAAIVAISFCSILVGLMTSALIGAAT